MKTSFKLIICFVLCVSVFTISKVPGIASEPLIIGVSHWDQYAYAPMMKSSFEMALEAVNKKGGVKGRPVKLVFANDQGKRQAGETLVKNFKNKMGAVMMIGGYSSNNTIYTARMAEKQDLPFLVCTAADDRITQRKWKNVFRMNPPAKDYTKGLEDLFLKTIKPRSLVMFYENSAYGTSSALRMMWFCRENGIDIQKIIPYHKERSDPSYIDKLAEPIKNNPPDVIYMVSYLKDAALLVKKIRELKLPSLMCGGAGGFTHQKFITMAEDAANYLVTATLWSAQLKYPGAKEYYEQYLQKYKTPPDYHGAEAYSALLAAADALNRADNLNPQSIRTALNQTDMTTPFGPVKFEAYGLFERQNKVATMVLEVIDGKFETVWPAVLASTDFKPPPYWRASD